MSRVFQPVLRKSVGLAFAAMAAASLLVSSAAAQNNMFFGVRPKYNGVPNAGSNIVFYNLPTSGLHAGTVDSSFDLFAQVDGTLSEDVSAFGVIATVAGTGEVVFNPPAIVNDENNLGNALNSSFPVNSSFDLRFAQTGIQGGGAQEVDIIALVETGGANATVTNGDGIATIPVQIAAGAVGTFNVNFNLSSNYSGFVRTISLNETEILSNPGAFPTVAGTIEVRESRKGDINGDGLLDGEDITPFISVLSDPVAYQNANPWLQATYIADGFEDGLIDGEDIQPFINILSGGSPAAVPEPNTCLLAVLGIAGIGFAMRQRRRF